MTVSTIDLATAKERLEHGTALFVDIRDKTAFSAARIPTAFHLSDETAAAFVAKTPKTASIVVVCYHGVSSRNVAAWLADQGFGDVCSLTGGFTAWSSTFADAIESD